MGRPRLASIPTPISVSPDQVAWFRLRRSGLVRAFPSPEAAAEALVGVQAQILPAAAIALFNRTRRLSHAAVLNRLWRRRSLVKLWGQRGTLHLYPTADWPLLAGAVTGSTWGERVATRRDGSATTWSEWVAVARNLLQTHGIIGRSELRSSGTAFGEDALSAWGGVFSDLVRRGLACHAPPQGNEGRFAWREAWCPDLAWNPPDVEAANQELLRRYLTTYGPARLCDFTHWRGVPKGRAQRWWQALTPEMSPTRMTEEDEPRWLLTQDLSELRHEPPDPATWPVHLLGRFDPLLLGHHDRSWLISPRDRPRVWNAYGHIEGVVLAAGRISGTWRYERDKNRLAVAVKPFGRLPPPVREAVEARSEALARFFGVAHASGGTRSR